jgi:hypothetical protein
MRTIGSTSPSLPSSEPTAAGLRAAARHQETGAALAAIATTGVEQGIYRFASHAEMNLHTDEALARAMALNARHRSSTK